MKVLQLLCLAGALASALNAAVIYDNIGESSAGGDGVDFVGPLFDSFVSAPAGHITDLQLVLSGTDTSSGAVDVGLYANSSATTPGALMAVIGIVEDKALSGTPGVYDITLTAYPLLTNDTVYWVGLSGITSAEWYYDYDADGVGVAGEFFSNQAGVFSNADDPYQMSVTQAATTAPEPPSGLLIAFGAGALALLSWRGPKAPGELS